MEKEKQQTAVQSLCMKLAMKLGMPNAIAFYVDHEQEILEALEMEKKQNKILIDALKDIQNWDEEHEEKWDDQGDRAQSALKKYNETYEGNNQLCCTPEGQIKRYVNCIGCDRKPLIQGGNK